MEFCNYICSPIPEKGKVEYLNTKPLYERIQEEINACKNNIRSDNRLEMQAAINAYELVQAVMGGIWNSGDRLYIKRKYSENPEGQKEKTRIEKAMSCVETELTKKETILLCMEYSNFLLKSAPQAVEDQNGGEAIYKAGIILLEEYGTPFEFRKTEEGFDRKKTVEELYAYFDYLRGHGMDKAAQGIILNAIWQLKYISFNELLQEEPFQKEQGWLKEKEGE